MKKYNSIDLTKFIMAILVIAIHTHPLHGCTNEFISSLYEATVKCAVPFFFIATGFFLGSKLNSPYSAQSNISAIKGYLIKTIKLYVIWSGVYLPFAIWNYVNDGIPAWKAIIFYLRGFFLVGENYNSYILWYLLSTIYTLIAILILFKRKCSLKAVFALGTAAALFGIVCDFIVSPRGNEISFLAPISKIIHISIVSGRIFTGAFYIPLGMIFSKKRLSAPISAALFLGGFIAAIFAPDYLFKLMIMICSAGLFNLVLMIDLKDSPKWKMLRTLSTVMYFTHLIVRTIYFELVYKELTYGFDVFVVTTAVTIIIGLIYYTIKEHYNKKALAHLLTPDKEVF